MLSKDRPLVDLVLGNRGNTRLMRDYGLIPDPRTRVAHDHPEKPEEVRDKNIVVVLGETEQMHDYLGVEYAQKVRFGLDPYGVRLQKLIRKEEAQPRAINIVVASEYATITCLLDRGMIPHVIGCVGCGYRPNHDHAMTCLQPEWGLPLLADSVKFKKRFNEPIGDSRVLVLLTRGEKVEDLIAPELLETLTTGAVLVMEHDPERVPVMEERPVAKCDQCGWIIPDFTNPVRTAAGEPCRKRRIEGKDDNCPGTFQATRMVIPVRVL